ncbi:UNVERIFIED_CONTAM: Retrovirus-related Pol polyprotein from transposon TNT 1-94 [Sesamum calycinum]|uniref:Retrovirus-related Pol polyprotein from transposon TNT 1-94 n=2 Tax=Sesamum TaxID=4181 RepID=A0AAW2RQ03_9LAMI
MSSLAKQISVPIFSGQNYDYWAIKMKTYFQSQKLWEIVEEGVTLPEDSSTSSSAEKGKLENKKAKDSEALYYIQTAVADHIFPRISVATSAKEAWSILQRNIKAVQSVGQMMEKGYTLHFGGDSCTIYDNKDKTLKIAEVRMKEHRCFPIHLQYMGRTAMKAQEDQSWLWHRRLGHFNFQGLKILHQKKMMTDLPQIQAVEGACEACLQGKQHKKPFPSGTSWRAKAVLELIHTDVCGPMRTPSHEQNRYFILFIDDYSRMTWVYFMREKSEVFKVFKKFKNLVEKQSGRSIKVLRSDRGKEYNNSEFDKFCEEEGIEHQTTVSYNPQQNGVSERKNRTVMEMARSMLQEKHLPKAFWAEAVYTAVYLLNRCPTKAVQNMTPIEAWSGKKPSAKHLRVFGSICYVHIPTEKRHKLEEKTEKGIFLGYSTQSKGYRIYNLKTKKLIISRDVEFDEDAMWNWDEEKVERQSVMIPKRHLRNNNKKKEQTKQKWKGGVNKHQDHPEGHHHQKRLRKKPRQEGQSFSVIYMKHATSSCWNQRILKPL